MAIVPARGGSKGIPMKNIILIQGKPLLEYTAKSARNSKYIDRIILSTDDETIADIGMELGLEVPFLRPRDLAQDNTPTILAIRHVLENIKKTAWFPDIVVILEPTSPLRKSEDIDKCLELLVNDKVDSVVSVESIPEKFNPYWAIIKDKKGLGKWFADEAEPIPRRQSLPLAYYRNGAVYVALSKIILENNSLHGSRMKLYVMEPGSSPDINVQQDVALVEQLLKKRIK